MVVIHYKILSQWKTLHVDWVISHDDFIQRFVQRHFRQARNGKLAPQDFVIHVTDQEGNYPAFFNVNCNVYVKVKPSFVPPNICPEQPIFVSNQRIQSSK